MEGRYADVIIDISHEKVDRVFQYRIPDVLKGKVNIGTPVTIPFGRGNTRRQGYIVGISDEAQWEESKIKEILEVPEKQLSIESRLIELAGWMKEHYGSTMIAALKTVTPVKEKVKKVSRKKTVDEDVESVGEEMTGDVSAESSVDAQQLSGAQQTTEIIAGKPETEHEADQFELNSEQKEIVENFCDDFETGVRGKYLLHGVTGSGKTEVYIELVKEVVRCGKTAIVLIPEISLTLQTVERFEAAFGDRISIINSRLSKGEKYTEFERARKGETVDVPARKVRIDRIELLRETENHGFEIRVNCGRGTYIRTLCEDLGKKCGCPAHMRSLLRTKSGAFTIDNALSLEEAKALAEDGLLESRLLPPDYAIGHLPRINIPAAYRKKVENGVKLPVLPAAEEVPEGGPMRIYLDNQFWGICIRRGDELAWKAQIAPEEAEEMN